MSILEILKLPTGFGYVLLVLGLILSLAPWFHGLDFGVLKVPDFSARARRVLKVVGPLALALAIGLHVPLPARDTPPHAVADVAGGSSSVDRSGDEVRVPRTAIPTGQRLVTTWQDTACLYPVRPVGGSGRTTTVRFDFGEEAERSVADLFVTTEPTPEIGADAWAMVPSGDAWAPGIVRDTRTNHLLIEFDTQASCAAAFDKPQAWIPKADLIGIQELENIQ